MKKILSLILIADLLCSVAALISCGTSGGEATSTSGAETTSSIASTVTPPSTTVPAKTETTSTPALTETSTSAETTSAQTTEKPIIENPAILPKGKSFKVLAIGNSFSIDAMQYLYGLAKDTGYTDIVLGNLYIGGCTLQTHAHWRS